MDLFLYPIIIIIESSNYSVCPLFTLLSYVLTFVFDVIFATVV